MKSIIRLLAGIAACGLLPQLSVAQVSLNSARVAAVDSVAVSQFYSKAFGMREVNRIDMGGGKAEVFLNFGKTDAEAKANKAAQLVIMHRDADTLVDPVPHVIFDVTDVKATAAAIKAAGGTMEREPFEFGKTGIMIGMAKDPVGNMIELLQQPKPAKP